MSQFDIKNLLTFQLFLSSTLEVQNLLSTNFTDQFKKFPSEMGLCVHHWQKKLTIHNEKRNYLKFAL